MCALSRGMGVIEFVAIASTFGQRDRDNYAAQLGAAFDVLDTMGEGSLDWKTLQPLLLTIECDAAEKQGNTSLLKYFQASARITGGRVSR